MSQAPGTLEGWSVLHDFRRVDWARLRSLSQSARETIASDAASFLLEAEQATDPPAGGSAAYRIVGHKADLLFLHLRPTVSDLAEVEARFRQSALADVCSR